ncbi:substrate-binding domain-containing protein [Cohnella luojiensis]|uniref:LacI family DNA-binding transcriptional regulator n=1 Tax=Cohnella luojiensis TaxID=652876 RepID=A0A4Y8LX49_9BACL|nr:substrate-binding domain-containing protein [Cohnella luojiensis]TFE23872.1 LacI family DNA-binding transcriptional regulator [Cohnella luojiensis]
MAKKVTMQQVANALGISKNSVSQALGGKPGVSEETRERVREAAERLGYEFSSAGKSSLRNHGGHIGMIVSESAISENLFFGIINYQIQKEVELRNYSLLIHVVDSAMEMQNTLPAFLEDRKVDGVFVLSHLDKSYIQSIVTTGIPFVMIDHHHPELHVDCVLTNNRFGAFDAVTYLISLGHKRIGYIGDLSISPSFQERWEGYHLALKAKGLVVKPSDQILAGVESEESIAAQIQMMTSQPDAWFCANDMVAVLLNNVLTKRGMNVPEDVSICGYDNNMLSELSNPPLTTVNVNKELFGKRAVERLFWRMDNPSEPFEELLLRTTLVIRDSTRVSSR